MVMSVSAEKEFLVHQVNTVSHDYKINGSKTDIYLDDVLSVPFLLPSALILGGVIEMQVDNFVCKLLRTLKTGQFQGKGNSNGAAL